MPYLARKIIILQHSKSRVSMANPQKIRNLITTRGKIIFNPFLSPLTYTRCVLDSNLHYIICLKETQKRSMIRTEEPLRHNTEKE